MNANHRSLGKVYTADAQLTQNFKASEFNREGLASWRVHNALIVALHNLRLHYRKPVHVVRGYTERVPAGEGVPMLEDHRAGRAADIRVTGASIDALAATCVAMGFGGVVTARDYVHVSVGHIYRGKFAGSPPTPLFDAARDSVPRPTQQRTSTDDSFLSRWGDNFLSLSHRVIAAPIEAILTTGADSVVTVTDSVRSTVRTIAVMAQWGVVIYIAALVGPPAVRSLTAIHSRKRPNRGRGRGRYTQSVYGRGQSRPRYTRPRYQLR
jgi:hypothetical protein